MESIVYRRLSTILYLSMCELLGVGAGVVGYDLACARESPFVDQEAFEADRASSVDFVGADADFGAEVVAEAIAEARAAIPKDVARIDQGHEPLSFALIGGDDAVGVSRAVTIDMVDRGFQTIDYFYREDVIEIFGRPVVVGCRFYVDD